MTKDPAIQEVLRKLDVELGPDFFRITDHWEADLCAVGISKPGNPETLVYISTYRTADAAFTAILEQPSAADIKFENLSFLQLAGIVRKHFR